MAYDVLVPTWWAVVLVSGGVSVDWHGGDVF